MFEPLTGGSGVVQRDAGGGDDADDTPRELGRLKMQFRMHQNIAEPVRRVFYPRVPPMVDEDGLPVSFLQSHETATVDHGVTEPPYFRGRALVWIDTTG